MKTIPAVLRINGLILVVTFSFFGQAPTIKNDIHMSVFLDVQDKADELIKKSSYRLTRLSEYFENRDKPGKVTETLLREVLQPDKWRTVEEKEFDGKHTRIERLWDGKTLYEKENDGEWRKFRGGTGVSGRIESGQVTNRYRHLGKVDLDGTLADLYEVETLRIANKFSATDMVVVRYVRKTRCWYSTEGRLLKKIEENMIEGREAMNRETTFIDYDPKISIEAPIK